MVMDNRIRYSPFSIPAGSATVPPAQTNASGKPPVSFGQILDQEIKEISFSQHALQRMQLRGIQLTQNELAKLSDAVEKAAGKGAKESLVLLNQNLALVVSVKNRTVITAMDGQTLKDNVFTNIDSAVIV
ncbi:TIGR02530 family flagellar biosynthesis protein [Acetonema longum]|uniref:Flagellar operon protein, putative n=1 Tax=Acetonema longum DSM 6540 TaxID=1009370 RepID=F7NL49_9FIRM|nr:TIGR02530 family flagellar biosynthesis protein [Acetonema longum]EGO63154.1 flagellar operon protein, putative [Acetonema longum DSM 6540]